MVKKAMPSRVAGIRRKKPTGTKPKLKRFTPEMVRELRAREGMSQEQFKDALGFSDQPQMSRIENGSRPIEVRTNIILNFIDAYGAFTQ